MPIRVKLDLIPEEANELARFAKDHRDAMEKARIFVARDGTNETRVPPCSHLERALGYLAGVIAHQNARYVPEPATPRRKDTVAWRQPK